jgi:hypothetical protein
MTEGRMTPRELSRQEIDRLMNPLLSIEERQAAWQSRQLGVQARKMQARWRQAVRVPLRFGFAACAMAFVGLNLATFTEGFRHAGTAMFLLWYPMMFLVLREYRRMDALTVDEI